MVRGWGAPWGHGCTRAPGSSPSLLHARFSMTASPRQMIRPSAGVWPHTFEGEQPPSPALGRGALKEALTVQRTQLWGIPSPGLFAHVSLEGLEQAASNSENPGLG